MASMLEALAARASAATAVLAARVLVVQAEPAERVEPAAAAATVVLLCRSSPGPQRPALTVPTAVIAQAVRAALAETVWAAMVAMAATDLAAPRAM